MSYEVGDLVRLTTIPAWVKDLPEERRLAFQTCHRRAYKIERITRDGVLVLDVSRDTGPVLGPEHGEIRVEAQYVAPARG